jgi:hypothetical protein
LLDFNSGLTNAFNRNSTSVIFLVRLYYGDETNFTGLSTVDYTDGSDFYKGAIASIGDISYDLNFFKFTTRQNGITLKIINSALFDSNKSFSDLVGDNNYDNRRFEIYAIGEEGSGTTKEIISYGTISANFEYNQNNISITLNDFRNSVNTGLPQTIIREDDTTNDFHYAPDENFNKPIPILYGSHKSASAYDEGGTFFNASTDRWAARSKVPAVIVNQFDTATNKTIAKVDTEAVKTLDDNNIYTYRSDIYSAFLPSNCSVDASSASVSFVGSRAYALIPFNMDSAENSSYSRDKFAVTTKTVTLPSSIGTHDILDLGVPDVPKLGKIDSSNAIKIFCIGRETSTEAPLLQFEIDGTAATTEVEAPAVRGHLGSVSSYDDGGDVTADFSSDEKETWDFTSEITLTGRKVSTSASVVEVEQAWLEILYTVEDPASFIGFVEEVYQPPDYYDHDAYNEHEVMTISKTFTVPKDMKIVYVSAEGRVFGSWIDGSRGSPGNSFNANDLIEHPAYVIEDILRTELGLGDANIDMSAFDTVASATSSYVCGFSQYNRVLAFELINDICRQFCFYFYFNGEGKATLVDKKLTSAYNPSSYTEDYSIDFSECIFGSISKTAVDNVKNKIRIEYDFDYGSESNRLNIETSSPNISDWNRSKSLTQVVDCNKIYFDVEANSLANAKLTATTIHDLYKDNQQTRKNVVKLTALNPIYLKSEIGDIVSLTNVPSDITIFGTAITTQNFMITKVSKSMNQIKLELTQVS